MLRNAVTRAVKRSAALRQSHSLAIPYVHEPVVQFKNGIPSTMARQLEGTEKNWDFWTSSDAMRQQETLPSAFGMSYVPYGETWLLKSGKVVESGWHFITPFVDSVVAVKTPHPVVMGVVTDVVTTQSGANVNGYAVVYIQVTDVAKSAQYVCPETNQLDSERGAGRLLRRKLKEEIGKVQVSASGEIAEVDKKSISEKLSSFLKSKTDEFGLDVLSVEIRGVFSADSNVPDKLRAMDPPLVDESVPGHNLSADYWSEVLSPPFFEKVKFGSQKELKTAAAVSLEWSIPSPPDFHHFNLIPRMTAAEDEPAAAVAKKH